jgi:hypothetical protein
MNRCTRLASCAWPIYRPRLRIASALALALCGFSLAVLAQTTVPAFLPQPEHGVMQITQLPQTLLNGKP